MAGRKPFIGGNWKMNLHAAEAEALAGDLAERFTAGDLVDVAVFPAFPYLDRVARKLQNSAIMVGAQDFYIEPNGAFTGEVSLSMLKDVGCEVVLVGHSERRHVIGESDVLCNEKVLAALEAGFQVILCVGEKIEQREAGKTDFINYAQTCYGLAGVSADHLSQITIAYEPVWAIGTGKTASSADAQAAHKAIRACLNGTYGDTGVSGAGESVRIQYGGSMKPGNAAELLAQPDIDGGLIGGAALKADDFLAIIEAAK